MSSATIKRLPSANTAELLRLARGASIPMLPSRWGRNSSLDTMVSAPLLDSGVIERRRRGPR